MSLKENPHGSFLEPFFREMNIKYANSWCVLHSYDNLPYFSSSDVDMAFSSADLKGLNNLIFEIAIKNEWVVIQKLWYDIEYCFYYVLKNLKNESFLALDFLIDNKGIGRYGFKTTILTEYCNLFNEFIPVPNHEVAFSYKFVKRLIKKNDLVKDREYLRYHFSKSNKEKLTKLLINQFGKESRTIIQELLINRKVILSNSQLEKLMSYRSKMRKKNRFFIKFWNFKRIIKRVLSPSGLILEIPIVSQVDIKAFKVILEKKLSISFRFYEIADSNLSIKKFKWFSGSTLVIKPSIKFKKSGKIKWNWSKVNNIILEESQLDNMEYLTEIYSMNIFKILLQREKLRSGS